MSKKPASRSPSESWSLPDIDSSRSVRRRAFEEAGVRVLELAGVASDRFLFLCEAGTVKKEDIAAQAGTSGEELCLHKTLAPSRQLFLSSGHFTAVHQLRLPHRSSSPTANTTSTITTTVPPTPTSVAVSDPHSASPDCPKSSEITATWPDPKEQPWKHSRCLRTFAVRRPLSGPLLTTHTHTS